MSWTGKILGGGIGFMFGGPLGAAIGGFIGHHIFDSKNKGGEHKPGDVQRKQHIFLVTTFSMLAKLSKADGRVSQEEINAIEFFMTHELNFDSSARRKAIEIFTKAMDSSDSFEDHARRFYAEFHNNPEILGLLIDLLMMVARSDGETHAAEKAMIEEAVHIFGLEYQYRQMMDDAVSNLDRCYALLGAKRGDSLSEIKKKYRKLATKYHPDRIHAEGVPPELAEVTEQKFKDIQNAYEEIEKHLAQIDSKNKGGDHKPSDVQRKQHIFLVTTFSMLAKLSKADGRVSQEEINAIEFFMTHELNLDSSARQKAIEIFTKAKDSSDSFEDYARRFYAEFHNNPEILGLLIDLLMMVARSDGGTHAAEKAMIEEAIHIFGLGSQYRQMMDDAVSDLDKCYALLGAKRGDSLLEIKKKYRKLAMKYHPDRIHAEGVPPNLTEVTEQKFKDIQNAYEEIEKHLAQ